MGGENRIDGATRPIAVNPSEPQATAAAPSGETVGRGCSPVRNIGLARSHAGNLARTDALTQICAGGDKKKPVKGVVSGGISRYFEDAGKICAEGKFKVTCNPKATSSSTATSHPTLPPTGNS